jgi:hypothetical protein
LSALAVLWLCIICFMRKRIALAITLIRESAAALTQMPLLAISPFLQTSLFAGVTAVWMTFSLYLCSAGDITTHTDAVTGLSYKTVSFSLYAQRAMFLLLFSWLWTIAWVEAVGQISSAHSVLVWYFAERRQAVGSCQVLRSLSLVLSRHSGTAAAGALLIAVLRLLRMSLEYAKRKLSVSSNRCTSRLVGCVCGCLSCLMLVFERFLKFVNKHAYIQCALHGGGFLTSSIRAYSVLFVHLGRVAAVSVVGDFVVLIGKLSVTLCAAGIAFLYFSRFRSNELNGFVLPTMLVAVLSFATATMFLGTLSAASDALLQGVLADEQRDKQRQRRFVAGAGDGDIELANVDTSDAARSRVVHEEDHGLRELILFQKAQWQCDEVVSEADASELEGLRASTGQSWAHRCPVDDTRSETAAVATTRLVEVPSTSHSLLFSPPQLSSVGQSAAYERERDDMLLLPGARTNRYRTLKAKNSHATVG